MAGQGWQGRDAHLGMHTGLHLQHCQPATSHLHQTCKLISLRSRVILEAHQPPQPGADRLFPLSSQSHGGLEGFPSADTCSKGRIATCPPPLSARWAVRQGTTARAFLSDTAHPCASLHSPPVPGCGCCLPCSPSSQPLMPRASCLCSKPSIPAQEQSQGAEPAKGTQLQPWLPSPPSLTQALLCTTKSHSCFLGRAPMSNPSCSRSSRVPGTLEPSGEQTPPKGLPSQHSR